MQVQTYLDNKKMDQDSLGTEPDMEIESIVQPEADEQNNI